MADSINERDDLVYTATETNLAGANLPKKAKRDSSRTDFERETEAAATGKEVDFSLTNTKKKTVQF